MQPNSDNPGKLSDWRICTAALAGILVAAIGCTSQSTPTVAPKSRQPYADVQLKLGCADGAIAREFIRRSTAWCSRTGAALDAADVASGDVVLIRPSELGQWMARGEAVPVPDDLRNSDHALQWSRFVGIWSDRLASWGGTPYAVPLAGESYVLVYDRDRFAAASEPGRPPLAPPTTWEAFAETAERLAVKGGPSLPSMARDPERALREFHFVAACYDRPSLTATEFNALIQAGPKTDGATSNMLAFHHDLATGEPRLLKPSFLAAARWVRRTAASRAKPVGSADENPVQAILASRAALAIASLAELGAATRADGAAPRSLGLAPLPGTQNWLDPRTGAPQVPGDKVKGVNFVPYVGTGGWIAVVRTTCKNPEVAFAALAELSGLDRSSELLSDPALGFGPFRLEHLDPARESIWQRYGFDAARSQQLANAIRHHSGASLANPAVVLRGSDRSELIGILAAEVTRIAAGTATPDEALKAADAAWRANDAKRPVEAVQSERRQAAGLR